MLFLIYRELEQHIFCKKYKKMVSIIEDKWDGNNWNWELSQNMIFGNNREKERVTKYDRITDKIICKK